MSELSIKIEGFPENVQRIADALEIAFPDTFVWVGSADETEGGTVKIEGYAMPLRPNHAARAAA